MFLTKNNIFVGTSFCKQTRGNIFRFETYVNSLIFSPNESLLWTRTGAYSKNSFFFVIVAIWLDFTEFSQFMWKFLVKNWP